MMDDEDLASLIVAEFMRNTPELLNQISDHISSDNPIEAGHAAHSLKGSAANLSASKLVETTFEIEQAGKEGNTVRLKELLPSLKRLYSELETALKSNGY